MSGVWRAMAHNEGAAVIFHGPKACGHVSREMELGVHFRSLAREDKAGLGKMTPLFSSELQEEHSIYGGMERLRHCIDHVMQEYGPSYILIANSCVAGVIGDDSEAVAKAATEKWRIPVLSVKGAGFLDGDYYQGFYHAGELLAKHLVEPQAKETGTVTILGDRGGATAQDALELAGLLKSLELRVISHFPNYGRAEDRCRVSAAEFSVSLAGTDQSQAWLCKLGQVLEERFATRLFEKKHPVGWKNTVDWLNELGRFTERAELVASAIERQKQRLLPELRACGEILQGQTIAFCVGRARRHFEPAWVLELFRLAKLPLAGVVIMEEMDEQEREEMEKIIDAQGGRLFKGKAADELLAGADMIITTHELAGEYKRQMFLPLLPPVGIAAPLALSQAMLRLANRHGRRGGVIYV